MTAGLARIGRVSWGVIAPDGSMAMARTKIMKTLCLFTCCCALLFAGCASIPPEALTYTSALKDYNKKAAAATLGAFDSSTTTIKYTLDAWKEMDATHSREYVDACKEASAIFSNHEAGLREISDLLALAGRDATNQSEIPAKIQSKINYLQADLKTHKASFDNAANTVQTRAATNSREFAAHTREVDLAAAKLHTLIAASAETVTGGLATEESLLQSYLSAQSKIKEVFGPGLLKKSEAITKEAGELSGKYSSLVSAIEATVNK
jgi:hypothetical protein